jgi:large subunit ribosomal protein L21e
MPHSRGARRGTRKLFQRDFRKSGFINLSTYMQVYKLGDYVDIKVCIYVVILLLVGNR